MKIKKAKLNFDYIKIYHRTFCPRILVADGAAEETNGFKDAYLNIESRVMCWIHMLCNVDKRLKSVNAAYRNSLRSGILSIQLSRNSDIFNKAIQLYDQKHRELEDALVNAFLQYFFKEWVEILPGW